MTYDKLCRLTYTSSPLGAFEQRQYVNPGDVVNGYVEVDTPAADGSGNQWVRTYYDGLGRPYEVMGKGPPTSSIVQLTNYNARGQVAQTSPPYYINNGETPVWETRTYDPMDRVVQVTHPDGSYVYKSYGFCGGWGCVTTYDEEGHAQRDTNDAGGRPKYHDEFFGSTVQTRTYTYDVRGNLWQITDGAGNTWGFTIDSLGRKIATTDPDAGSWSYAYDNAGRLTSQTDALNQTTTFAYDALGRRTQKTTRAGTPQATTATWVYDQAPPGYYNVGRLSTTINPSATSVYYYDALGRAVLSTRTIGGTAYNTAAGYDAGGRHLWTSYPDGTSVGTPTAPLTYDGAGRLYSIPGFVNSISYDARGNPLTRVNTNGTTTTKTYDPNRLWLTGISTTRSSTTIQNLVYSRDIEGKIRQVTSPFSYEGWAYDYDQHRLTSATNLTNSAYSQTFTYNTIGNITYNSWIGTFSYPPAGSPHPHAVTQAGSTSYTYDADGNMLSGSGNFAWDGDSYATSIDGVAMAYDVDGLRVQKVFNSTVTNYVSDSYEVTNGVTTKYITVGGEPVARCVGATSFWIHTDVNGSIQAETDSTGVEVQRQKYMPFGQRLQTTTSLAESRGYTAERQDETGLFYLHARYYDPFVGRFDSPDPTVPSSTSVGLNRYAYAGNDPVDHTDRNGLSWLGSLYRRVSHLSPTTLGLGGAVALAWTPFTVTLGLGGALAAGHDGMDKAGAGVEYLYNQAQKYPVISDIATAILPTNAFTGAVWIVHDARHWVKPAAKGAILDAACILSIMTAQVPMGAVNPEVVVAPSEEDEAWQIIANASIGGGKSFGLSMLDGKGFKDSLWSGVVGAAVSGGTTYLGQYVTSTAAYKSFDDSVLGESTWVDHMSLGQWGKIALEAGSIVDWQHAWTFTKTEVPELFDAVSQTEPTGARPAATSRNPLLLRDFNGGQQ